MNSAHNSGSKEPEDSIFSANTKADGPKTDPLSGPPTPVVPVDANDTLDIEVEHVTRSLLELANDARNAKNVRELELLEVRAGAIRKEIDGMKDASNRQVHLTSLVDIERAMADAKLALSTKKAVRRVLRREHLGGGA